jgi:hypothetical protein
VDGQQPILYANSDGVNGYPEISFDNGAGFNPGFFALRAYQYTQDKYYLRMAKRFGDMLKETQQAFGGGWTYDITWSRGDNHNAGTPIWSTDPRWKYVECWGGNWQFHRAFQGVDYNSEGMSHSFDDEATAGGVIVQLKLYEKSGDVSYLDSAKQVADVLADLVDPAKSPKVNGPIDLATLALIFQNTSCNVNANNWPYCLYQIKVGTGFPGIAFETGGHPLFRLVVGTYPDINPAYITQAVFDERVTDTKITNLNMAGLTPTEENQLIALLNQPKIQPYLTGGFPQVIARDAQGNLTMEPIFRRAINGNYEDPAQFNGRPILSWGHMAKKTLI